LTLAQQYGEFLNVKIENMSLQHSEREAAAPKAKHKRYGIVTVASGDGMSELFRSLGADVVINGGQTGNPAAEEFLKAFAELEVDHIIVLPNNKNILLTAKQAAELSGRESVSVIPTKSFPEGYAALAVFNSSVEELDEQISDMTDAKNAVSTIEITEAVRDTVIDGISVKEGETLGILDGKIVCSTDTVEDAVIASVQSVCDLDEKELLTVFVGAGVAEEERAAITELIEDRFEDLSVEVFIGNQEVYKYVISIE
jgi:dihydroxyacetone kinase-like predicted kinase